MTRRDSTVRWTHSRPRVPRSTCPTPAPPDGHWRSWEARHDDTPRCSSSPPLRTSAERRRGDPVMSEHVVSVGVDLLADALADQAADVRRVDWRPPIPGTEDDL